MYGARRIWRLSVFDNEYKVISGWEGVEKELKAFNEFVVLEPHVKINGDSNAVNTIALDGAHWSNDSLHLRLNGTWDWGFAPKILS